MPEVILTVKQHFKYLEGKERPSTFSLIIIIKQSWREEVNSGFDASDWLI